MGVKDWADLGALAILAGFIWVLATKTFPEVMRQSDQRFGALLAVVRKDLAHVHRALAGLTVAILHHDATVRGQNPEVVGDTKELYKRVLDAIEQAETPNGPK